MKYLRKLNRYFHLVVLFGLLHCTINAQTFLNKHYLSDDIENLINSNPDQALKIAQYLLSKNSTSSNEKARINFLISKAYLAKGDYSSALNFLYEEKNYKNYLTEEQKINIDLAKITILSELKLDKQSTKILKNLERSIKTSSCNKLKSYLEVAIAIEKAKFLLKNGKVQEGISVLRQQELLLTKIAKDFIDLKQNYTIALGKLYLEEEALDQANNQF